MPHAIDPLPGRFVVNERFGQLFWGLVAVAVGMLASAVVLGAALGRVRQGADQIEVTGSARQPARADLAVWRLSLTTMQPSLRSAYQDIQRQGTRVRNYLRAAGIADSAIEAAPAAVEGVAETVDGRETGRTLGYRATQAFTLRSRDLTMLGRLAVDVTELINEGIALSSGTPEFILTGLDTLRVQLLAAATEDARRRADAIARGAGSRVGGLRAVRTGVIQVVPRHSTEVSDYGINDVSAIDKDVMAVVRVTFAVR